MENSRQLIRYLEFEEILMVADWHERDYQILQENQLHYLVDIVKTRFGDTELFSTVFQKAAVYAHHIITGHIFFDGNKRIGLTCALWFLTLNGYSCRSNIDDSIVELGLEIARKSITDIDAIADHIQQWILEE